VAVKFLARLYSLHTHRETDRETVRWYWHGSEFRSDTSIVGGGSNVVRMARWCNTAAHHDVVLPQRHVHVSVGRQLTTGRPTQQRWRSTITRQHPACKSFRQIFYCAN